MRYALILAILLCSVSGEAMARKLFIKGSHGATTVSGNQYNGVVVTKGATINGGTGTGLTVTGTAAQSVTNKGTITGSTGLFVSGSSSVIKNTGTIRGSSVGVWQVP